MKAFCLSCILCAALICISVQSASAQGIPRFEPWECQFDTEALPDVTCGYLHVLEDRANPQGAVLRLHVAIFHSYSESPAPDPVIYLEGGPGGNALETIPYSFYGFFEPFLERRDVIIFDQRGTGYSEPLKLQCPEYQNMQYETLDEQLTAEQSVAMTLQVMTACRDRLESRGVDLADYTSAANAADLAELRVALDYESWNLYGISYGTRLALTTMRDYPTGIRSVIIDGVVPPQVSLYDEEPANVERALNTLFLNCTLDPVCNAAYPRLGTVFYEQVTRLNAQPANAVINHPVTDAEYNVLVTGDLLVGFVFSALYSVDFIPLLPKVIYDVRDGNYRLLASTLESILYDQEAFSMGMHFSVQCSEEAPFTTRESVTTSAAAYPPLAGFFDTNPNTGTPLFTLCDMWGTAPPNPIETLPVFSSIPTLVFGGEYDPITPPRWGHIAASTLPNSYVYDIPGVGHGASVSAYCPMEMMLAFLDNPGVAPDSSCIAEVPRPEFLVVDNAINLVPFSDSDLGLSGLYPESWMQVDSGSFMRSDFEEVGLFYYAAPGVTESSLVNFIAQEFNIWVTPRAVERLSANGLGWQIYEFRRGEVVQNIALASDNVTTYLVILVSLRYEQPELYQTVLIPAVQSLRSA